MHACMRRRCAAAATCSAHRCLPTHPCAVTPQDVDFHPSQCLLATGVIDGHLVLHSFDRQAAQQRHKVKAHGTSCRAVRFSGDGALVYTASTDETILAVDAATGAAQARKKGAHDAAINRLATTGATSFASGVRGSLLGGELGCVHTC